jgi:outer membrane protein TolC
MQKVEQLALELKWKREVLKPTINLNYNVLTKPFGDNQLSAISMQNYKVGITGYVPLFLRKERGGVRLTKAKMENASYDLADKKREYQWKVSSMSNDIQLLSSNLTTQQRLVDHAKKLRDAELMRFYAGESSLFLINTREQSYLSAENKLVELEIKYAISSLKMKWLLNKM